MSASDDTSDEKSIPIAVQVLIEQQIDEETEVFLTYDAIASNDSYIDGRVVAKSELTEATYTITDDFSIPVSNIQSVESDIENDNREIWLSGCSKADLQNLFDNVTIAYTLSPEQQSIGN